jgi:ATP-dependent DNA helicase RecG
MELDTPLRYLKGVGEKTEKLLNKLEIYTVYDLLCFLPRDYKDFTETVPVESLAEGAEAAVCCTVEGEPKLNRIRRNLNILKFTVGDGTGRLAVYYFNQPYLKDHIKAGDTLYLLGRMQKKGREARMDNPLLERGKPEHPILPVYRLTAGLNQKKLRQFITNALATVSGTRDEIFSPAFRKSQGLCETNYAYENIHFPIDRHALQLAKKRLIFEELMLFAAMLDMLSGSGDEKGIPLYCGEDTADGFKALLPFAPTAAQERVMGQIAEDFKGSKPMNRLIQGDVGSGKTALAFFAMYACVKNGYQCAMMAPTEVLARQHFESACRLFQNEGIRIELITGSKTAAQKRQSVERLTAGQADMLVGTHALIYENVEFFKLGLVVTDEQHRFGVRQRAKFVQKGEMPHTLIMSATPIPRTLALILYGRTDISVVDEMPPGRTPVKTHIVPEGKRHDMYGFIKNEIISGGQAFVVCPLIEANEDYEARSAEEIYDELKQLLPGMPISLLHGRMKAEEKNSIMQGFSENRIKLLVSTTVIEVGVNVPNATIMVVENAERFGLAQLHQLRGRVGRGEKVSYCFLTSRGGEKADERLQILVKSNDGFYIAEKDLEIRGPGEFLGTRQNGVGDLYMANLIRDMSLLTETREIYEDLKKKGDPEIVTIREAAQKKFQRRFEEITMS